MALRGNKGEWSEAYAFIKLLGEGKVYAADENLKRMGLDINWINKEIQAFIVL